MTREDILEKIKTLNFKYGDYIVFGSCPLALHGIRETKDIDLLVNQDIYETLKKTGWKEDEVQGKKGVVKSDVFEAYTEWNFGEYNPSITDLLESAEVVDGIPFANLEEVVKWKQIFGREKDIKDLELIEEYVRNSK